jgi:hypothetical protein
MLTAILLITLGWSGISIPTALFLGKLMRDRTEVRGPAFHNTRLSVAAKSLPMSVAK